MQEAVASGSTQGARADAVGVAGVGAEVNSAVDLQRLA